MKKNRTIAKHRLSRHKHTTAAVLGGGLSLLLAGTLQAAVDWSTGTTITNNQTIADADWTVSGGSHVIEAGPEGGTLSVLTGGSGLNFTGDATITLNSAGVTQTAGGLLLGSSLNVINGVTARILNGGTNDNSGYIDLLGLTRTFKVDGNLLVSGLITNGGLIKTGAGTFTLTSAVTSTGGTFVEEGTMLINGSTATGSAVSVASLAKVGGSGTIGGTLTVSGKVAPGASGSIGILQAGNTIWNGNGSENAWEFQLPASGNISDQLQINGTFTKGEGSGGLVFDFMGSSPVAATTFTLLTFTSQSGFAAGDFSFTGLSGSYANSFFTLNDESLTFTASPEVSNMQFTSSPTSFSFTPIPEASNVLAGALLGLGLLRRRRTA